MLLLFYRVWLENKEEKLTQLVFCDLSTPKNDGTFNVYDDIKNKLIAKGVPEEEIEFIHNAKTNPQKLKLFEDMRNGTKRILNISIYFNFKDGSRNECSR